MDALVKTGAVEKAVAEQFTAAASRLPGGNSATALRTRALRAFEQRGVPHRRIEEWKYTDLRSLMRTALPVAARPDAAALARAAKAAKAHAVEGLRTLVLVDGSFVPELSDLTALEGGLQIRALADVLAADDAATLALFDAQLANADPMFAVNAALMSDGLVIDIADDTAPARPLHIVHVAAGATPASMYTRSLVRLGANAQAMLAESFIHADGSRGYQVNDAVAFAVGDHARLDHVRMMEDDREAQNISTVVMTVGAGAQVNSFNMTTGGAVSRYQGVLKVIGPGARVETNGVNLLNGTQHGDTTLVLDHAVPDCASREVFRAVLDDRARSVFQGRINVWPDAQKTDAKMMTRALLLSDEAEADNKPELEIFADDVTCGHGATSGALDESLLFYLRARGLPEAVAQALLIQAFVGEAIESIADDRLRAAAMAGAQRWVEARM